ncbi:MAG: putative NACHT family NTPase, partial [Psychrobacter okhotskensis]
MIMELQAPSSNVKDLHEILKDTGHYLSNLIGKDYQKFATKYNFALKDYLYAKSVNLSKVKMAFFSSQVVELDEIYVPQNIRWRNEVFTQSDFFDVLLHSKKMVVSATAGSGKSCFLKSIFINIIRNERKLLPLFLELRKVNETSGSIIETLRADIATYNNKFNKDNLDYLLNRDGTIIFLDGFDEVNYDLKENYLKEINNLADRYPNLIILTSSRPEYNEFTDWSLYSVVKIDPLNISQAIAVIENLKYDEKIKETFIEALNFGLFAKHEGFSSNPLLLTIMLITYEQFGDIPDKVHIFYDLAYQALFNKHDVTKESFHRKSLTNLDMYELRNIFSLFCLATYYRQTFKISEEVCNSLLTKSLGGFGQNVSSKSLKLELLNNVPLLM